MWPRRDERKDSKGAKVEEGKVLLAFSYALWLVAAVVAILLAYGPSRFGPAFLLAMAAFWSGMLLGFLFAIPKYNNRQSFTPDGKPAAPDAASERAPAIVPGTSRYLPNTNLTDISDWLTKIIVGLGLVNLGKIPAAIQQLGEEGSRAFGRTPAPVGLVNATLIASVVIGLFVGYLTTRVFWSPQLARSDDETNGSDATRTLQDAASIKTAVAEARPALDRALDADTALATLRDKANEYLAIDDPDHDRRAALKTKAAGEMGRLIVDSGIDRATVAQERNEGMLVGLASAIVYRPLPTDTDLLLGFASFPTRLHVQYQILQAYLELARQGFVSPQQKTRMQPILNYYESRADDVLKTIVKQARAVPA